MAFEIVHHIPEELLKGEEGSRCISKNDLEKLQERCLVYFLKTTRYQIIHDYPCCGAYESRFQSSNVTGPFEEKPTIEKQGGYAPDKGNAVLTVLLPIESMPPKLETITSLTFGTYSDHNTQMARAYSSKSSKLNIGEIRKIGQQAIDYLRKRGINLQEKPKREQSSHTSGLELCAETEHYMVDYSLDEGAEPYPIIRLTVFGKNEEPQRIMNISGLTQLRRCFNHDEIVFTDEYRKGIAHSLPEGTKVSEIKKSPNLLL